MTKAKTATAKRRRAKAKPAVQRRVGRRGLLRTVVAAGGLAVVAAIGTAIMAAGGPAAVIARAGNAVDRAVVGAGFGVARVEVIGAKRSDAAAVEVAAGIDMARSVLVQDLSAIRDRVEALPWVEHAAVGRNLPGVIRIEVTEHRPFALWQHDGSVRLIDPAGIPFIEATPTAYPDLPLVVGAGAATAAPDLAAMLATAPELAARVSAAVRVGDRRWDLKFANGVVLSLPEEKPTEAWQRFAALEATSRILDQGYARLDLRLPDMLVVRQPSNVPTVRRKSNGRTT